MPVEAQVRLTPQKIKGMSAPRNEETPDPRKRSSAPWRCISTHQPVP